MSLRPWLLAVAVIALSGCASDRSIQKKLTETLRSYSATIRWGEFAQAQGFVDPEFAKQHPISPLEQERYHQLQVSYYHDSEPRFTQPGEADITVEIGLVNINTQSARSTIDQQHWHWDEKTKRWWLMTGLPDISHH